MRLSLPPELYFITNHSPQAEGTEINQPQDYLTGLKKLWGGGLTRLREATTEGAIEDHHLQHMALPSKMNVLVTYRACALRYGVEVTLDRMLEKWFNDKLYDMTPQQAQSLLIEVLKDSKVAPNYISQVKKAFS